GVVAGSSVLGMLIPPSLLLILFGIIAEVSIGDLFSAGIVPGNVLAVLFCLLIVGLARFAPGFTGTPQESDIPLMRASVMLQKAAPIVLLILLVLGGIYGGFFTPTEAGAVGALGALLIAVAKRRLGVRAFGGILMETGQVTASITFLLIAAHMYSRLLALSGLPGAMVDLLAVYDFSTLSILLLYLLAIILLGTILDAASILLILVPLVLPIAIAMHLDMVWFGILTVVAVEVGLLTPPLGMACFVIRSNLDDSSITLGDIFAGALPFALVMLLLIALLIVLPGIAIFLL
ncbi:MAG: TRAP transporter large permease subunit, partial [Oricola sp.]|nr:TRAP transporter large permease subunit [Oricola sp.]